MSTSPSIAPHGDDQDAYLVLEDFGLIGRYWRETDADNAGREALIRDLAGGQYRHLVRIVAFNAAEGWCLLKSARVRFAFSCCIFAALLTVVRQRTTIGA